MKEGITLTQFTTEDIRLLFREELQSYFKEQPIHNLPTKSIILSIDEVCEYAKISKSHCYKLTSQNLIPHSKKGKRLYFNKVEIDNWLLGNPIKTSSQIAEESKNYLKSKGVK